MATTTGLAATGTELHDDRGTEAVLRVSALHWFLGVSLLLSGLLAACSQDPESELVTNPVLARVGSVPVDANRFFAVARTRSAAGEFPRTGVGFQELRDRLLKDLVVEEVLLAEAGLRGVEVGVDQADEALQEVLPTLTAALEPDASGAEGSSAAERAELVVLERFGSVEAYRELLRRRLTQETVEALVRGELAEGVEVPPAQVDAAMERFAEELIEPAGLRALQVFVADAETARQVREELAAGADLASLAQKHNGGDGDMGWMSEAVAPSLLLSATRGLEPGQLSDVVQSPLGYHVFQLIERRSATPYAEAEARDEVERRLRGQAGETRFRAWLASRTDELGLEVDEAEVKRVRCCRQGLPYLAPPQGVSP